MTFLLCCSYWPNTMTQAIHTLLKWVKWLAEEHKGSEMWLSQDWTANLVIHRKTLDSLRNILLWRKEDAILTAQIKTYWTSEGTWMIQMNILKRGYFRLFPGWTACLRCEQRGACTARAFYSLHFVHFCSNWGLAQSSFLPWVPYEQTLSQLFMCVLQRLRRNEIYYWCTHFSREML